MSEKDELNTAKLDIDLSGIDFKENKLDTFLQGAYDKTVAVSHNDNCTFHSMGRNALEMCLEDKKKNIENGLGERIIKKLIQKHGNKLENPVWADAGWHPFGSFAYRKSFWESVKYYFSNATWGWFNIINPFFWLSELIWGEYENDFYSVNKSTNHEIELHIDKNLSDKDKYCIGNILGQLIREEIVCVMETSGTAKLIDVKFQESTVRSNVGEFIDLDLNELSNNKENNGTENLNNEEEHKPEKLSDEKMEQNEQESNETENLKNENLNNEEEHKPDTPYKKKMVGVLYDAYHNKRFNTPYVNQGSHHIIAEWQYLTSNDFLEDKENDGPLEAIVLEVSEKPISANNAKLVLSGIDPTLYFYKNASDIKNKLDKYQESISRNKPLLICVIGKGYFIGRCQPVSINEQKDFVAQLLNCINMPDPVFLKNQNYLEVEVPPQGLINDKKKNKSIET